MMVTPHLTPAQILRWILVPIAALVSHYTVNALLVIMTISAFINHETATWLTSLSFTYAVVAASLTAPRHHLKVAFLTWFVLFIWSTPNFWNVNYLQIPHDMLVSILIAPLLGGLLAIGALYFWYSPQRTVQAKKYALAGIATILAIVFTIQYIKTLDFSPQPDPLPSALTGLNITNFYSYDLGGFIDTQEAWRIDANETEVIAVASRLDLQEVREVPKEFFSSRPSWWPNSLPKNYRAWTSSGFVANKRGQDGNHTFLLYDQDLEQGYIWLKNNF